MATTLAGNLTLIGSVANLIVVEAARAARIDIGFLGVLPGRRPAHARDAADRLAGPGPGAGLKRLWSRVRRRPVTRRGLAGGGGATGSPEVRWLRSSRASPRTGSDRPRAHSVVSRGTEAPGAPPRPREPGRALAERVDEVEDAQDLAPVADHGAVARLAPAHQPVAIDHERGAIGDVALLVEHAVVAGSPSDGCRSAAGT